MEGFLEEVTSKLRLNEWEGGNQLGRERRGGVSPAGRERWWRLGPGANGGSGVKRPLRGGIHRI